MSNTEFKLVDTNSETYFAGANSGEGFLSEYASLVSEEKFEKIYMIKGGPGVGKSTAMKKCASHAASIGADVVEYRCGSDASSLDCVTMSKNGHRIAVLDATAPHTMDPAFPGSVGEIVDFGSAWDSRILEKNKDDIISLCRKKGECFKEAYRLLHIAMDFERSDLHKLDHSLNKVKMNGAIRRILKKSGIVADGVYPIFRYAEGITMGGAVRVATPEKLAKRTITVSSDYGCGALFIGELYSVAATLGIGAVVYRSALDPDVYNGILFTGQGVLFKVKSEKNDECDINMMRFLDTNRLAETRKQRRFENKYFSEMFSASCKQLEDASGYHFAIEKIYGSATDFRMVGSYTDELIETILSKLS